MIYLVYLGLFAYGMGFIFISNVLANSVKKRIQICQERVEAKIIDTVYDNTGDIRGYQPVYEYSYNDKTYTVNSYVSYSKKESIAVGNTVPIYINKDKPEEIYENTSIPLWLSKIFLGVGILSIIGDIFVIIFTQI